MQFQVLESILHPFREIGINTTHPGTATAMSLLTGTPVQTLLCFYVSVGPESVAYFPFRRYRLSLARHRTTDRLKLLDEKAVSSILSARRKFPTMPSQFLYTVMTVAEVRLL